MIPVKLNRVWWWLIILIMGKGNIVSFLLSCKIYTNLCAPSSELFGRCLMFHYLYFNSEAIMLLLSIYQVV